MLLAGSDCKAAAAASHFPATVFNRFDVLFYFNVSVLQVLKT